MRRIFLFIVMAASLFFNAKQAQAQSGIELTNVGATVQYGESITFVAEIKASIQIQQASIVLFDETQGLTQVQPLMLTPEGHADFRFDTQQNRLRPFSTLRWYYEIVLADGSASQSDTYAVRYEDNRFPWQTLNAGTLQVHWYNGDANFGAAVMNAAQAGLQSISHVLPLDLTQPTGVYIYANEGDLQATLAPSGEAWVAGHADPALGVVTAIIAPGTDQALLMEKYIPHELTHVMTYRSLGAGYVNLPAWLSEGVATLAEINPSSDYDLALTNASAQNGLIPLKDLCASFSARVDQAFLGYAEARAFTRYLLNTYGSSGLMSLATSYADGVDCERGPERAFGKSLSQLELDWRASITGQSPLGVTLGDSAPYLLLFCLVLFIPFIAIVSTSRNKGNSHGSQTVRK
ncbi:MAG: peptidase MA family metallohydrolase [Anaerolineales bacterium]